VDPTGQFWNCHVAVIGRGADKARSRLLELIEENKGEATAAAAASAERVTNGDVQAFLTRLSMKEALGVACECIQSCMTSIGRGSRLPFVVPQGAKPSSNETQSSIESSLASGGPYRLAAFSIARDTPDKPVRWYSHKELSASTSSPQGIDTAAEGTGEES